MDEHFEHAPRPGDIKKVILVTYGEKEQIKTYETVIEALAAVYRLDHDVIKAIETAVQMATAGGES